MNQLLQQIYRLLAQIIILRRRLILKKCKDYLGVDFTPLDVIPDEVGCAEAVTTILKQAGVIDSVIAGTWTLNRHFEQSKNWLPTNNPQPGDVIISPTGHAKEKTSVKRGHVGIVGDKGIIYSNDSYTGKWMANYTIQTWHDRYSKLGKYPVYYYTYLTTL